MAVWAGAGALLAILLLLGGVAAARALFRSRSSPPHTGGPTPPVVLDDSSPPEQAISDLAFVPRDAHGVFSLRVADLWTSSQVQKAWKKLPARDRDRAEQTSQQLGLDLADFERITLVVKNELRQEVWAVLRTTQAFDQVKREKLLSIFGDIRWEQCTHAGFEYQLATAAVGPGGQLDTLAAYRASDRVLVVGPEAGLRCALDSFKAGATTAERGRTLSLIEEGKDQLVMATVFHDDDRAALPRPPAMMSMLIQGSNDVKVVLVTARLGTTLELMGTMTFPTPGRAKEMRQQLERTKQLGQPLIRLGNVIGARAPPPGLLAALHAIRTEARGADLVLRVEINLDEMMPLLPDLVASQVQIQSEAPNRTAALRQLATAFERYYEAHGCYPQAVYYSKDRTPLYGWRVALLPYLGEKKLYDRFDREKPWSDPANLALLGQMPRVFAPPGPPSEATKGGTGFQLVTNRKAVFFEDRAVKKEDLAGGRGKTLLLVEHQRGVAWTAPDDLSLPDDPDGVQTEVLPRLGLFSGDSFQVVLFDGSIQHLKRTMKAKDFLRWVNPKGWPASE